jgi:hypothetical protein
LLDFRDRVIDLPQGSKCTPHWRSSMKLIASLIICLGLSACATDYVSQLSEPDFGRRGLHLSPENIDPTQLMDGTYASRQMNGLYGSKALGAFCWTDARCSQQLQPSSSGWNP